MNDESIISACRRAADGLLSTVEQVAHHHSVDEEYHATITTEHGDIATTASPLDAVLSLAELLRAASNLIADSCGDAEVVDWQLRCWSLLPRLEATNG